MSHPFNYRIDGTVLATIVDSVRLGEGVAGKRADLIEVAYRHGAYVADRHWTQARLMPLRTLLKREATPADIYTSLYDLETLLLGRTPLLARNDPVNGEVQAEILVDDAVEQPAGDGRFGWTWPIWQLAGHWEEVATNSSNDTGLGASATIGPLTIGGNHPTSPKFTITCQTAGSNPALEDNISGDKVVAAGAFIAADVIVIDTATGVVTKNGTRIKNLLTINRGHLMEFPEDSTVNLNWTSDSGSWDVLTEWKDRHR